MRNKNISTQSNELLTHFNGIEKFCFKSSEAFEVLSKSSKPTVNQLLSDMTKRGLLMRIKDRVYYIIPYEKDPESFMPDWHLLTENLVNGIDHYIGYYSALQLLFPYISSNPCFVFTEDKVHRKTPALRVFAERIMEFTTSTFK
ncbi:MAG TPA: hypothetical protein VFC65_07360 [Prolixibacteraceae bacterium]|nr:hypothetical protein [Prolixibacteraceae bacterium]